MHPGKVGGHVFWSPYSVQLYLSCPKVTHGWIQLGFWGRWSLLCQAIGGMGECRGAPEANDFSAFNSHKKKITHRKKSTLLIARNLTQNDTNIKLE